MKLWIPMIGDGLRLEEDWNFHLHPDYRNHDLFGAEDPDLIKQNRGHNALKTKKSRLVILPRGTELVCDRVYIRQGRDDYASITFIIKRHPTNAAHFGCRFWASLEQINNIVCVPTDTNNPIGPISKSHYKTLALPDDERLKKQAANKKSKENKIELDVIRSGFLNALREGASAGTPIETKLRDLVKIIERRNSIMNPNGRSNGYTSYRTFENMLSTYRSSQRWIVVRTTRDKVAQTTQRLFAYQERVFDYRNSKSIKMVLPAFNVVSSREHEIISIEPLDLGDLNRSTTQ